MCRMSISLFKFIMIVSNIISPHYEINNLGTKQMLWKFSAVFCDPTFLADSSEIELLLMKCMWPISHWLST